MNDKVSDIEIEKRLDSMLKLVEPNPEFVKRLGHRLVWMPETIIVEENQPQNIRLLGGLLLIAILAVVIWLVQRAYRLKS
jgi:hypothetical protein